MITMRNIKLCTSYSGLFYKICLVIIFAISIGALAQTNEEIAFSSDMAKLSRMELSIWNNPAFKKEFIESYIAETEVEPRVTVDEREDLLKIFELISEDKMDEAAKKLEKLRNEAATAVYDFMLASIYLQQDRFDEATKTYKIAVDKYPKYLRAWKNLGIIYIQQSDFEKALPALTKVIELGGGDSTTYGLLGYAYSSVENNLPAESAYRMAILLDPATLDWKMGLARSLFKQERFAEAIALCEWLIEEQPDQADLWLLQANAYIGLNQPIKAAEIYELVDSLGKSTVDSLNMLGDIYINEELYELAVKSYIRAIEKTDESSPGRAIRAAKVLAARGAFNQTKQLIENIEKLKGSVLEEDEQKDLLKLRARIAVAEGATEEEVRVLEEIVELDPLDGEALILLGQNSARNDDTEKAIFYFERAEAIEKYEADAKVRHAQLLVKNGKYTDALPLLRRAQAVKPRDNIQKYLEQVERVAKSQ